MKILSYLLTTVLLFGFTSCKKEKAASPPPPYNAFTRSITYTDNNELISNFYTNTAIKSFIRQSSNINLVLAIGIPFPEGHDNFSFTIDNAKLKQGYTGTYSIVQGNNGNSGDVKVQYNYSITANSANPYLPGNAEGSLTITKFDKEYNMLSGTYLFEINTNKDPRVLPPNDRKDNNITVSGAFENVVITNE